MGRVAAHLETVEVDEARRRLAHIPGLRVAHHSHDLEWLAVAVEDDVSSDGVAIAEKVTDQRLIDDGHARAALVLKAEIAPHQQRNSEGRKVLRRDPVLREEAAFAGLGLIALHGGGAHGSHAGHRKVPAHGGGTHARNGFQTPQQFLVGAGQSLGVIAAACRVEIHQQNMVALEAQVEVFQL